MPVVPRHLGILEGGGSRSIWILLSVAVGLAGGALGGAGNLLAQAAVSEDLELVSAAPAAGDDFGFSLALGADGVLAVGAPFADDQGLSSGAVILYQRQADSLPDAWLPIQSLETSGGGPLDELGFSLALSGERLITGAREPGGTGKAYIFECCEAGDWREAARLTATDGQAEDWFGYSVAIAGDLAAVGARFALGAGAVYIYERDGAGEWSQIIRLLSPSATDGEQFGTSLALVGDQVIVGAPMAENGEGAFYTFSRHQGGVNAWGELGRTDPPAGAGGLFGWALDFSAGFLAVGAPEAVREGVDGAGGVHLYEASSKGVEPWAHVLELVPGVAPGVNDHFGFSLTLRAGLLLAGAPLHDGMAVDSGASYAFRRRRASWVEEARFQASGGVAGDELGASTALAGSRWLAGSPFRDLIQNNAGAVMVFSGRIFADGSESGDLGAWEDGRLENGFSTPSVHRPNWIPPGSRDSRDSGVRSLLYPVRALKIMSDRKR